MILNRNKKVIFEKKAVEFLKMLNDDVKKYRDQMESFRSPKHESYEFSHLSNQIYLDHAANAIYMSSLIKSYQNRLLDSDSNEWCLFSNPHSRSQSGEYTSSLVESIREKVLSVLFETSSVDYDLVFVANATAGLRLLGESLRPACLAYLADNHTSVIGMREIESNTCVYCAHEDHNGMFTFKLVKSSSEIER